jgi:cell division septation protein DedD
LSSPAADKAELARLPAAALASAEVNVAKVNKIDGVQTSALPEPSEIVIQSASTVEIPVERAVEIADEPPIEIMAEPVSAVGVPPAPPAFGFAMQFGAYANKKNAERASAALKNKGLETYVTQIRDRHDQLRYAVRAGYFAQRQEGRAKILSLDRKERSQVLLVPVVAESTVQ